MSDEPWKFFAYTAYDQRGPGLSRNVHVQIYVRGLKSMISGLTTVSVDDLQIWHRVLINFVPITKISTISIRDTHFPFIIFYNPVSSASHRVPGPHFEKVWYEPCGI